MLVSELFTKLSQGVFSNLSIGMDGGGDIAANQKAKIIGYLNEALMKLHSKFVLKQSDLTLMQDITLRLYRLSVRNAVTYAGGNGGAIRFIQDTVSAPFTGDLIKILQVTDSDGCDVVLNDPTGSWPLFTPQPDVLKIVTPMPGLPLVIGYQARHPVIAPNGFSAEIDIPATLETALVSHIAYQTFFHMNGQEHAAKSADHLAMFEEACNEVSGRDLVNGSVSQSNTRFELNGWV